MNARIVLSADTGCEMHEADFFAWVSYVGDHIDARCGFEVEVEAADYGDAFADRISAETEEREQAIREAKEALWEDWCATGWDAWRAPATAPPFSTPTREGWGST